jgi:hypothetical protein
VAFLVQAGDGFVDGTVDRIVEAVRRK